MEPAATPRRLTPILIGVLALLVVAGVTVVYLHPATHRTALLGIIALTLPRELTGSQALSAGEAESILYHFGRFSYERAGTIAGRAVAAAPSVPDPIFIVVEDPGFKVVSGGREYYAATSAIAPSASPAGGLFAFSRVTNASGPFTPDPTAWETVLANHPTGELTPMAGGTASAFLDDTHLLRLMAGGVFSLDLASGVHTKLLDANFTVPVLRLAQSPDRTLVAWTDVEARVITVYRVTGTTLEKVASLPSVRTFSLGDTALYELRIREDGAAEVWSYALETGAAARKLYTFPKELRITELYP